MSRETDQSVRRYLAGRGDGREGEASRFVEKAVRAQILELTAEQAKTANAGVSEVELTAIVTKALA